jgi:hypothetical protein
MLLVASRLIEKTVLEHGKHNSILLDFQALANDLI